MVMMMKRSVACHSSLQQATVTAAEGWRPFGVMDEFGNTHKHTRTHARTHAHTHSHTHTHTPTHTHTHAHTHTHTHTHTHSLVASLHLHSISTPGISSPPVWRD